MTHLPLSIRKHPAPSSVIFSHQSSSTNSSADRTDTTDLCSERKSSSWVKKCSRKSRTRRLIAQLLWPQEEHRWAAPLHLRTLFFFTRNSVERQTVHKRFQIIPGISKVHCRCIGRIPNHASWVLRWTGKHQNIQKKKDSRTRLGNLWCKEYQNCMPIKVISHAVQLLPLINFKTVKTALASMLVPESHHKC